MHIKQEIKKNELLSSEVELSKKKTSDFRVDASDPFGRGVP